jgi:DNA-directed RNA polymerase specialized sigma24 family protein
MSCFIASFSSDRFAMMRRIRAFSSSTARARASLPTADRRVIELRYRYSRSTTEMAVDLEIPVKRVKRDVERAKWRLRIELQRQGFAH